MILYDIEGPKGVGKTTLINQLLEKEKKKNIDTSYEIIHFDGSHPIDRERIIKDDFRQSVSYFYDRGFLSSFIYSFLYNVKSNLKIDYIHRQIIDGDFYVKQITMDDLEFLIQKTKNYIVMYAEDYQILNKWLRERDRTDPRNLQQEYETLVAQNRLFQTLGTILNDKFDNVSLYSVDKNHKMNLIKPTKID